MAEEKQLKEALYNKYQCNTINLCKALGIRIKDYKEYFQSSVGLGLMGGIQLAQLKTLLEIKEILIDNIIEKATRLRPK